MGAGGQDDALPSRFLRTAALNRKWICQSKEGREKKKKKEEKPPRSAALDGSLKLF